MGLDPTRREALRGAPDSTAVSRFGNRILPAVPSPRAVAARGEVTSAVTILVVDDDPVLRELVAEILRCWTGFQVLEAVHGADAQRIIRTGAAVDLLLTDLAMPVLDGLRLVRWFRIRHPDTPVVMMSGSLRELTHFHEQVENVPLLVKPFTPNQLVTIIRAVLRRHRIGSGPNHDIGRAGRRPALTAASHTVTPASARLAPG